MQSAKSKRTPTIRRRLRRAVLLPSAAFIALWLAISGYLGWEAVETAASAQATSELSTPAAVSLTAVMDERSQTVAYLERPEDARDELVEARQASDKHTRKVFDRFETYRDYAPDAIRERMAEFEKQYRTIDDIREEVDEGTASREKVLDDYNRVMTAAADLFDEQSRGSPQNAAIGSGMSATDTFRVVDLLALSDARLTRSFTNGKLTHDDQQEFTRLTSSYHSTLEHVRGFLSPEQGRKLERLMNSDEYKRLVDMESRIVDHDPHILMDPVTGEHSRDTTVPMEEQEWRSAYTPVKETLTEIGAAEARHAAGIQADAAARATLIAGAGSVGVALVGFLAISSGVRTTHRVVGRLGQLRDETDRRANDLLPDLVGRLRNNEPIDSASAIPQLTTGDDEIGKVASSFQKAQHFAVDAAVRQSELAHGINRVFLNIAHRSQTLIHRQLRLLDRMEREQEDPDQLTDLFKLDHLATRSRRNAENLLILGGENPGRTFHKPMPLVDVLRGAISESGDYTRVDRRRVARVALKGPAVADVIHLVAELVDNATTFSPPQTKVRLSSEQVPNGVVVEIEDRGLGMQDDELAAANEILANPPEFDVMRLNDKMRLGLFVVSRLAQRHEIGVRLRTSPYGGVEAIVLLPSVLIADAELPDSAFDTTGERSRAILPKRPGESGAGSASDGADGNGQEAPAEDAGAAPAGDGDVLAAGTAAPAQQDGDADPGAEQDRTASGLPRRSRPGAPGAAGPARGGDGAAAPAATTAPAGQSGNGGAPANGAAGTGDAPTAPPPPPGGGADPEAPDPAGAPRADADGRPPLPKRRPQENLAPQLHENPSASAFGSSQPAEEGEDRSARLRRNMSAFQQGTRRGRDEAGSAGTTREKDSRP
ncbi:hypothetical protein GCM10023224_36120 [Streptomonospora halophila]|uniref:histidine kinase n=1 Tax=Streptomonospora halophila TaxID=427369 RepID=A0ABP9GN87_9ACTN